MNFVFPLLRKRSSFARRWQNVLPLLVILLLFVHSQSLWAQGVKSKFTVSGYVKDGASGETLIGAAIKVKETGQGVYSNEYGFYSLTLPAGSYTLQISYLGYAIKTLPAELNQNVRLEVPLELESTTLGDVTVTSEKATDRVTSTDVGRNEISIEKVKRIPALLGETDLLKALQYLPGITSAGDGSAGFYVRGGTIDQNLIQLDEAPVFNASHLLGFFSVFNTDAIKSLDIYRGAIPARYGGRLSSLVDVRMREGNNQKFSMEGGIGLIASRLTIQGPIRKGKMSYIASGRRTYADLFLKASSDANQRNSQLYFYDFNAKVNWNVNEKNQLFLSGYFGRDVFSAANTFGFSWGNTTATLRWNHLFSDKLFSNLTAVYSDFDYSIKFFTTDDSGAEIKAGIKNYSLKYDYSYFLNDKLKIYFGGVGTWYDFDLGSVTPIGPSSLFNATSVPLQRALEAAAYVDIEQTLTKRLSVRYGLRYNWFGRYGSDTDYSYAANGTPLDTTNYATGKLMNSYAGFEPRLQLRYTLDDMSSIKFGYSRTRQNIHLASNSTASLPTDLWVPSGRTIKPQVADQYSVGYFRDFNNHMYTASIEGYYKNMYNQIDFRDGAQIFLNEQLDGQILSGRGVSYGAEFFLQKNEGNMTGWISYTLSWTDRQIDGINNGNWYPAKNDKRHNLNLVLTQKLGKRWEMGGVFTYSTGNAVSFPATKFTIEGQPVAYYTERNGYRLPDYHRLDLSFTYKPKKNEGRRFYQEWNFSVYNVYGQKNPYYISFRQNKDNPAQTEAVLVYLFTIIPSVTWNFKF